MSFSFPPLQRASVFIAAPGDLEYLRDAAILEFETLRHQAADDHGLEVYDWMLDKAEDGFKDWIPAQGQIPLPSDEKCKAVICMLGERIGTPLSPDFDTRPLGPLDDIRGDTTRLVHPWVQGAEEDGGFALTGTVFEYLAALRANRSEGRPPAMLLLVGDNTIRDMPDALDALWGGGRLREQAEAAFRLLHPKGNRARNEMRDWEDRFYKPQLVQLGNFVSYLTSRLNIFPRIVEDEEQARKHIRNFLRRELDLRVGASRRDPFKGLEAYRQEDSEVFFGREIERQKAVQELTALWDDPASPTFYGVTGGSGVGKSSMTRAALIGHLCHHTSHGRYVGCVVRPMDLLEVPAPGMPPVPLLSLYRLVLAQVEGASEIEMDAAEQELSAIKEAAQPAFVLKRLESALQRRGENWRLLLGFDQFEELLDQRVLPDGERLWTQVVELILLAANHHAMGVIYTLQTNRVEMISQDPWLGPLWAGGGNLRLAFPMHSLDEIIRMPFRARDLDVEPEVVRELSRRIEQFARECDFDSQGSLLPLVSLTLRRIFEAWTAKAVVRGNDGNDDALAPETAEHSGDRPASATRPGRVSATLCLADCAELLDVSGAITQLADEAVNEARAAAGASWSDDATVGNLLRRLVRLSEAGSQRLTLPPAVLPGSGAVGRLAEALTKRRLLLPESDGHSKLVHEAVFVHWPEARKWLTGERRLLRLIGIVGFKAEDWEAAERAEQLLATSSDRDLDEAAELLVQWADVFTDDTARAADVRLRDYALSLLNARPMPLRVVSAAPGKSCHIHVACIYGAVDLVKAYVSQEPGCVHATRKDGRTPLFNACFTQCLEIVEILLQGGAVATVSDEENWQPVHAAATGGQIEIVEMLVRAGASAVAAGGPWLVLPLHLAAASDHRALATWLTTTGRSDPGHAGRDGWTALHGAAGEGHAAMIRQLTSSPRAPLEARLVNDMTPLHLAASNGRASAVRALIDLQADVGARAKNDWANEEERNKRPADKQWTRVGWTPLHMAVNAGHEAAANELLLGCADVNASTEERATAMMMAVSAGREPLVRMLLRFAPSLELRGESGQTAFHLALATGHYAIAEMLADAGADVDAMMQQQLTPLHAAVSEGFEAHIQLLLSKGASVSARAAGGQTPLHLAAMRGRQSMLQLLLERGADPALVDDCGSAALHLAARAGHNDLVTWLVRRTQVDAAAIDHDGMSALHQAVRAGHLAAAETLLSVMQSPDPRDADGWTPLILAAQCGHTQIVAALLRAGADPNVQAERPMMGALQAAAEGGWTEIIALLVDAGAKLEATSGAKPTALLLAVRNAQFEVAHDLLDHGAATRGPAHDPGSLIAMITSHQRHRAALDLPISKACVRLAARLRVAGTGAAAADPASAGLLYGLPIAAPSLTAKTGEADLAWDTKDATASGGPGAGLTRGPIYYQWGGVTSAVADALREQAGQIDSRLKTHHATTVVEQVPLPWYNDRVIFRLTDPAWPHPKLAIYYIGDTVNSPGSLYRLDGTSIPLYTLNASVPIGLDVANVLGYLKFFCFFVRTNDGPFYVLESADDPIISRGVPEAALAVVRNTVYPATLDGRDDQGSYLCSAVVLYSNALFIAAFSVQPDGTVAMLNDEPVAVDLPLRIDAPIA